MPQENRPSAKRLPPLILLAAGKSSRTPRPKGLTPVEGEPWIARQLAAFREAGGEEAIVVLGFHAAAFLAACPWLADGVCHGVRVRHVVNPDPDRGPFSSLQTALALADGAVFLLPVDVPAARPETWRALTEGEATDEARVPVHAERGGHPVWLSPALVATLHGLPATARLDEVLRDRRRRIPVDDDRVTRNLNTPSDWELFARES